MTIVLTILWPGMALKTAKGIIDRLERCASCGKHSEEVN